MAYLGENSQKKGLIGKYFHETKMTQQKRRAQNLKQAGAYNKKELSAGVHTGISIAEAPLRKRADHPPRCAAQSAPDGGMRAADRA